VIEHIRPKYSCWHCEQQDTEVKIKIAPVPPSLIPKSIATPSILARSSPVNTSMRYHSIGRNKMFWQFEIDLNRKTLVEWMLRYSELHTPVYPRLKAIQLQQPVIHADETPLKVIHEDKSR
jgi:transposase